MFSTSMMASSTTTPRATTSPASTITLMVAPRRSRTRSAAASDSGMAMSEMNAVRHSKRKAARISTTSATPISRAVVRFSMAASMNVAGRKIEVSICMPGRPGRSLSIASSTPRVTSSVFVFGYFWTISMIPGPSLMTASPCSGWCSSTTRATSARRRGRPPRRSRGTSASCSGFEIGRTWRMFSRRPPSSRNPPVPTTAPSEYLSSPASSVSAVVSMTLASVIPLAARRSGSTWTCCCGSRSPQIATFATPGTRRRRCLIFQ